MGLISIRGGLAALLLLASPFLGSAYAQQQARPAAGETIEPVKVGDMAVSAAWARATPGGAKVGGGYLTITNTGTATDRFVGLSSPLADHGEIHEMSMNNGIMTMRPLPDGIEIKPGETVELKPGGYHLMFMDIKTPFKAGERVKATLQFEKAGKLDVDFAVAPVGAMGAGGEHHH